MQIAIQSAHTAAKPSWRTASIDAAKMQGHCVVAGGFDYLLKVRVSDMAAYRSFLGDIPTAMPGVRETRTYAVLEEVKATTRLAV